MDRPIIYYAQFKDGGSLTLAIDLVRQAHAFFKSASHPSLLPRGIGSVVKDHATAALTIYSRAFADAPLVLFV